MSSHTASGDALHTTDILAHGGVIGAGHKLRPALMAGVLSGVAGLLVFLVIHALWILPIWFILPVGLGIAALGGLAVGWSYAELRERLPNRPWTAPSVIGLIGATLLPSLVLAELRPPLYTVSAAGVANLAVGIPEVILRFIGDLLATSAIVGAALGWRLGRTRRAMVSTALAGLVFALGPGHNIPFIGGTSGVGKELAIMAAVITAAALVLVEGERLLRGGVFRREVHS